MHYILYFLLEHYITYKDIYYVLFYFRVNLLFRNQVCNHVCIDG